MNTKNKPSLINALLVLFSVVLALPAWALTQTVKVTDEGFEPKIIEAKAGTDLILNITRVTDSTCATDIQIPAKKIKKPLPLNKTVQISLGKFKTGDYPFGCSMGMMIGGTIKIR